MGNVYKVRASVKFEVLAWGDSPDEAQRAVIASDEFTFGPSAPMTLDQLRPWVEHYRLWRAKYPSGRPEKVLDARNGVECSLETLIQRLEGDAAEAEARLLAIEAPRPTGEDGQLDLVEYLLGGRAK